LQWTRVNQLPDFVYFNHSIHINKGVGCNTCHGPVDQMPLMYQQESLPNGVVSRVPPRPEKISAPRQVFNMRYQQPTGAKTGGARRPKLHRSNRPGHGPGQKVQRKKRKRHYNMQHLYTDEFAVDEPDGLVDEPAFAWKSPTEFCESARGLEEPAVLWKSCPSCGRSLTVCEKAPRGPLESRRRVEEPVVSWKSRWFRGRAGFTGV